MFRVRRIVGWMIAVVVALCAATLLGLNLYVQSQGTQARIQQELSQRLGMPLQIRRISVTPWSGLKLSGMVIPQTSALKGQAFLTAQDLQLRVRLRSIFWRPLVIKEIALIKPVVVWPQNESGKWRLPVTVGAAESQASPPAEQAQSTATPSAIIEGGPLQSPAQVAPKKNERSADNAATTQVKRVNLIDGSFHFLDRQDRNVALFDGVQFFSTMRDIASIRGETRVAKIALRDRVFLSDLHSPVRYDPEGLGLSALSAHIAKGKLTGSFEMQPQAENSPFTVNATFQDVQADQLVTEAGGPHEIIRGVLQGTLNASGNTADALSGEGTIELRDGHVQQFTVLAAIGQLLQIEELTQLDLQQAEAKFHLANREVLIDELVLRSPNLRLSATGSVTFDGKLALNSTLSINEKIRAQLFRGIRENFVATDEPGQYALPFHVGGSIDRPTTDLMSRAVGADLRDLGGVIDALLGRGKSKKKKHSDAPTPEPSASPALTP
ncbi:MAG: hypothetical protein QOH24_992 [Verrucomicrobiota bacterium]|jgi:uncharacterized protein involved in outer membrane biogenesis